MFDDFRILSGNVFFSHTHAEMKTGLKIKNSRLEPGIYEAEEQRQDSEEIFEEFTTGDEYGFTKTVVPVKLAQYGDEKLISRSQAKRLMARVDRFKVVILDFYNVEVIGHAFADEVFRVFARQYPRIEIIPIRANKNVKQMIQRALSCSTEQDASHENH